MRIIDCQQGTNEWRLARAGLATASCFAQVLAEGTKGKEAATRRNLRTKLVLQRITGRIADGYDSYAMRQGVEREPAARLAYQVASGDLVQQVGFCRHDTLEAGASPDGLIESDGALEIKSPEPSAHYETLRSEAVPSQYVAQCQGVMWICDRAWLRFVSFNPDFPEELQLKVVHVRRDQAYIDRLRAEVAIFMDEVRAEERDMRGRQERARAERESADWLEAA